MTTHLITAVADTCMWSIKYEMQTEFQGKVTSLFSLPERARHVQSFPFLRATAGRTPHAFFESFQV